jgi:hypothetical protein
MIIQNMDLPPQFPTYPEEIQQSVQQYLCQLTPIQKKAYLIAKEHLGSSFNIVKSNGYIHWLKNKK